MIPYDELVHQAGREILQNISKEWEKPEPEKEQDKKEPENPEGQGEPEESEPIRSGLETEPEQTEAENQDTKSDEPDFLQPDLTPESEPQREKEKIDTAGAMNFHFNQSTMSLLFCVILFYMIFLPLYLPLSEFVNIDGTI